MTFEQLLSDFRYEDLQWLVPIFAGLVIIVGGLLVALVRGMSSGAIVALVFGGLLSLSPVLLDALQRAEAQSSTAADLARSAAELSALNNDVVADLSRVVASLRLSLQGVAPLIEQQGAAVEDPALAEAFADNLTATEDRLNAVVASLSRANLLRERMAEDLRRYEAQLRAAVADR